MKLPNLILVIVLALQSLSICFAAEYPTKSIRIVVPYPPGAFNDTLARTLAQKLGEKWKNPIVVDNRPGAGTVMGTEQVARARPDGHTLLIASFAFAANPSLQTKLPYDSAKDFAPVILAATTPNLLAAHPSLAPNSVGELIAAAKAKPGQINYGSAGNGSSSHLCMELLKHQSAIDLNHVPYKGSAPAVADLLGGNVALMFNNVPNVLPHIKAGKLKVLAVSGAKRIALLPAVPTIAESGVADFDVTVWFGVLAPAATPREIIIKLNAEIARILALPDVKARFAQQGVDTAGGSPEAFAQLIKNETVRWAKVVKISGAKID